MKACPRCNLRYPGHATRCFVDGAELVVMQDPRIGTTLGGRYEVESLLAEGGMATVYFAHHRMVDRPCAIKILRPSLARNKTIRERFRREAKASQKLAHPNIIEIQDQGNTDDDLPYIVMELLEGETLADAITRGPMTLIDSLPIGIQVARALARAHDFDVIHRDLKPENVFLCRTQEGPPLVKLLDFGIARSLHDARLTNAGEVFGTPQYMAPERISSIDAGSAADLYSIGVLLFEMLTSQLPFQGDDVSAVFARHMKEPPPSLESLGVEVPPALQSLVMALMAKVPEKRPVDAHKVETDLVAICRGLDIPVPPEPKTTTPPIEELPQTLPPTSIDRWARRTLIFEQMLHAAHGSNPPEQARDMIGQLQQLVRQIRDLRAENVEGQRKLTALEAKARDARQRFGFAVDALGVDASKARDLAREALEAAEEEAEKTEKTLEIVRGQHVELLRWEGRCAFNEPHQELANAHRAMADAVESWLEARTHEKELRARVRETEGLVGDLEYQIAELRAALTRMEQSAEHERAETDVHTRERAREADSLEQRLLELATVFCEPMRKKPELEPLFHQLERDGA